MTASVCAVAAGGSTAALVLVLGVTAAAWTAAGIAVLVIVAGAIDYVRGH